MDVWVELRSVSDEVHRLLYVDRDRPQAKRRSHRLADLLQDMPEDDGSIVVTTSRALTSELADDVGAAVRFRRREICMLEHLHRELADADDATRTYALQGREESVLKERRTLVARLEARVDKESMHSRRSER